MPFARNERCPVTTVMPPLLCSPTSPLQCSRGATHRALPPSEEKVSLRQWQAGRRGAGEALTIGGDGVGLGVHGDLRRHIVQLHVALCQRAAVTDRLEA